MGHRIYVEHRAYVVVGVIETRKKGDGQEPPGLLLVPTAIRTALTGKRDVGSITLRASSLSNLERIENQTSELLQQLLPGQNLKIKNNVSDILEQQKILQSTSYGLLAVGIIALLIGGVGIANITIAAVVERTSEIGLRRALGATRLEIMTQFILEAALLSLLGGSAAVVTVHVATTVVTQTFELPYQFSKRTAVLALGSALMVGVGAVYLPALRASQLDPVKALRSQ